MNVNESEIIAQQVLSGNKSAEDGARALMEIIYRNKKWFGLYKLDLDQTHDFLIAVFPKLVRLFSIYDPSIGAFTPFLYAAISSALTTWRRKIVRISMGEESIRLCDSINVEESNLQYDELEFASCSKPEEIYETKNPSAKFKLSNSSRKSAGRGVKKAILSAANKKELQKKEICLYLALKSSYFMDEDLIEKVSKFVELPSSELRKMLDQMNAQLGRKINRREICIRKRDSAFFYHRKYMLEMLHLNSDTSLSEKIKKSFAKQTKCWIEKNNCLKNKF